MIRGAAGLLFALAAPAAGRGATDQIAAGARLEVRIGQRLTAGRDSVGTVVHAQLMAALTHNGCVVVPAYAPVLGTVTQSRGGRRLDRAGVLAVRLDSLQLAGDTWLPLDAVIDSIEWTAQSHIRRDGTVVGTRHGWVRRVELAAAGALVAAPMAAVIGVEAVRRGGRPSVLSGELAAFRTRLPIDVPDAECVPPNTDSTGHLPLPPLPPIPALTSNERGTRPGDPINLVLVGDSSAVAEAFAKAGWVMAATHTKGHVGREVAASVLGKSYAAGPVSPLYVYGRSEDVAYEREGHSARRRHHLRLWTADSTATVWIGTATKDVGLKVNPLSGRATHRIAPDVDWERDEVVRELEQGGCARLLGFERPPGAVTKGVNLGGDDFETDGNAAVVRMGCGG